LDYGQKEEFSHIRILFGEIRKRLAVEVEVRGTALELLRDE
jgi:hypothetical protein